MGGLPAAQQAFLAAVTRQPSVCAITQAKVGDAIAQPPAAPEHARSENTQVRSNALAPEDLLPPYQDKAASRVNSSTPGALALAPAPVCRPRMRSLRHSAAARRRVPLRARARIFISRCSATDQPDRRKGPACKLQRHTGQASSPSNAGDGPSSCARANQALPGLPPQHRRQLAFLRARSQRGRRHGEHGRRAW